MYFFVKQWISSPKIIMANHERVLTNSFLSLISHPSSVSPNEAPGRHIVLKHPESKDLPHVKASTKGEAWKKICPICKKNFFDLDKHLKRCGLSVKENRPVSNTSTDANKQFTDLFRAYLSRPGLALRPKTIKVEIENGRFIQINLICPK